MRYSILLSILYFIIFTYGPFKVGAEAPFDCTINGTTCDLCSQWYSCGWCVADGKCLSSVKDCSTSDFRVATCSCKIFIFFIFLFFWFYFIHEIGSNFFLFVLLSIFFFFSFLYI